LEYNNKIHSETHEKPVDRWRNNPRKIVLADEEKLRRAFLWTETRKPDKSGVFSLFGTEFQVCPRLAKKAVQVRYDPERRGEIEIWYEGNFVERIRPFHVQAHRRPAAKPVEEAPSAPSAPSVDWLDHLVSRRRKQNGKEPTEAESAQNVARRRQEMDDAVFAVLHDALDPAVLDAPSIQRFLDRYGPFEADSIRVALHDFLEHTPNNHHVQVYLDAILTSLHRDCP
jgi:hypothetical protein